MKLGISLSRVWSDEDVVELHICVADGVSSFTNNAYVGHAALTDAVGSLTVFKNQVHSGILDLCFGKFGPEFANGAFHARFHFAAPGKLFLSCKQESQFVAFGKKTVASNAALYLKSEPALLDRFLIELHAVANGTGNDAYLEAI